MLTSYFGIEIISLKGYSIQLVHISKEIGRKIVLKNGNFSYEIVDRIMYREPVVI